MDPIKTMPPNLKKSVYTLALMPDGMPYDLSLVDRKIFNVLILLSMRSGKEGFGPAAKPGSADTKLWYAASITEIARLLGLHGSINYQQIKTSMTRLMRVVLEFSSPSPKDMTAISDGSADEVVRWKGRHLIEKADINESPAGLLTVYWRFDDEIEPLIIDPERFALLRLSSITSLSDPRAIALYEICARYAATGSTGHKPWTWWVGALTGQMTTGPKKSKTFSEYKYFYQKAVKKAIEEINDKTEITIELDVRKEGRVVSELLFQVKRKSAEAVKTQIESSESSAAHIEMVIRAKEIKLSERVLLQAISSHGVDMVEKALSACEAAHQSRSEDPRVERIGSMNPYFSGVLKKKVAKAASGQSELALADAAPVPAAPRPSPPAPAPAHMLLRLPVDADADKEDLLAALNALSAEQLDELVKTTIERVEAEAKVKPAKRMFLARTVKNLRERNFVELASVEVRKQLELIGAQQ
jgi:hypothetical protein